MIYYSTSNSFPVRFIVKLSFSVSARKKRRYVPLQQSNKDYERVSLLQNYLSSVIFIGVLKTRSFNEKKKELGVGGCERNFSASTNKKASCTVSNMSFGSIGLIRTRTYWLLPRCTGESNLLPKKQNWILTEEIFYGYFSSQFSSSALDTTADIFMNA